MKRSKICCTFAPTVSRSAADTYVEEESPGNTEHPTSYQKAISDS